MKTDFSCNTLCALLPKDQDAVAKHDFLPFWLCYRVGNGPQLYRCAPPEEISGGILAAVDSNVTSWRSSGEFVKQVIRECHARNAQGFCANWSQPPSPASLHLLAQLETSLSEEGLSLYITEPYRDACDSAFVLLSTALSGGTLRRRMEDAVRRYGAGRIIMAFERMSEDFSLPSPHGKSRTLSPSELTELKNRFSTKIYTSEELCAHYFTTKQGEQTHIILFDDADTFRQKRKLAQELELAGFLFAWEEGKGLLESTGRV